MAKFPVTTRNSPAQKTSGAAPNTSISLEPEHSRFLIAAKECVAPTPLANTVAPAVTGTATQGQTLTCTQGTWTGANGVYTYEWQRQIGGAGYNNIVSGNGASTYVIKAEDVGYTIRCRVRGINGAGVVYAASNATAAVT